MKSLLNKRLPGILALGLVALAVGAAGATAGADSAASNDAAAVSALSKKQKKAKKKALKKCKKIKKAKKRKACIKRVKKKYKNKPGKTPAGQTHEVQVVDDIFIPGGTINVKSGDLINWVWSNSNANPHNVTLSDGPSSLTPVEKYKLSTANSPATQYSFKRQLTKVGLYSFYCTLHSTQMKLDINVTR
jgi:plastocyanin